MKKVLYLLISVLLLSGCSHRIVRTGYKARKSDYRTCDVVITKDTSAVDLQAAKLGEIRLGESGFSVACSEKHAIDILKGEACAINADLIVITDEKRPDFWSSCYRCSADFYRLDNSYHETNFESDEDFASQEVRKRVSKDRSRNASLAIGSAVVGALFALLLVL